MFNIVTTRHWLDVNYYLSQVKSLIFISFHSERKRFILHFVLLFLFSFCMLILFNVALDKFIYFWRIYFPMFRVTNLKRKWSDYIKQNLQTKYTNLGNSFPEYFFVCVFSDFPSVVCWLQNELDFLHYSILPLDFL